LIFGYLFIKKKVRAPSAAASRGKTARWAKITLSHYHRENTKEKGAEGTELGVLFHYPFYIFHLLTPIRVDTPPF
jgi:hypothetical protein